MLCFEVVEEVGYYCERSVISAGGTEGRQAGRVM